MYLPLSVYFYRNKLIFIFHAYLLFSAQIIEFLGEFVIDEDSTVAETKKELLQDLRIVQNIDIPFERCVNELNFMYCSFVSFATFMLLCHYRPVFYSHKNGHQF